MKTTTKTEVKTLAESLLHIQTKLKAPKGLRNTFGNYSYRNTEGILEAVKPLLAEEGVTQTISDELVCIGNRYYIKSTVKIQKAGDIEIVCGYAREEETKKGMDASQITGASSSYARKYALNGLYLIDDTKDADSDEYKAQQDRGSDSAKPVVTKVSVPKDKPELIKGSDDYKKVVTALTDKKATLAQVLTKFSLSTEIKAELEKIK